MALSVETEHLHRQSQLTLHTSGLDTELWSNILFSKGLYLCIFFFFLLDSVIAAINPSSYLRWLSSGWSRSSECTAGRERAVSCRRMGGHHHHHSRSNGWTASVQNNQRWISQENVKRCPSTEDVQQRNHPWCSQWSQQISEKNRMLITDNEGLTTITLPWCWFKPIKFQLLLYWLSLVEVLTSCCSILKMSLKYTSIQHYWPF